MRQLRYSLLDLSPIVAGGSAAASFAHSLDLARRAERWGYHRYWLAEHHNIPGVASAATAVLVGHIAGGTSTIRVGSGGIMLPNHAPLVIAEQFGTLESLYPGRIDLGLGRAPGGDMPTARALRRNLGSNGDTFPQDVLELQAFLAAAKPEQTVRAIPGVGLEVPIYLLGSSTFSAQLAAELGLPFAFASHFAPDQLHHALALYRQGFKPSATLAEPYVIVGVNVIAAETVDEARYLFTSQQQAFLNLVRGRPGELQPPADRLDWSDAERAHVDRMTHYSVVDDASTAHEGLERLHEVTQADEFILTGHVFDHEARLHSYELAASALRAASAMV